MPASVIVNVKFFLALLLASMAVHAESFEVRSAQISKIGNGFTLNATIQYPLTPRVIEAIDNGVPITFIQQLKLINSIPILGSYWQWQEIKWSTDIRYELRYHALSQQYVLHAMDTNHQRNFPSLYSALNELGKISGLTLPPEHFNNTDDLILQLRSGLDLHALPTPMRPGAILSNKWQLTSPWVDAQWD